MNSITSDNKGHIDRGVWVWPVVFFLFIPIWMGTAPVFYEWYGEEANGLFFKSVYSFLTDRWLVNVPICLLMLYCFIRWWIIIWHDCDICFHRLILCILWLVILYYKSNVEYAQIFKGFDYRCFFTLMLVASLAMIMYKILRVVINKRVFVINKKEQEKRYIKKFSTDDIIRNKTSESLEAYAKEIVERLLATDLSQHSFALGITGEWGVGKTTFLNVLKEEIGDKAEIIKFNPWMCRTPEQVVDDFFATLRQNLSPKYSSLSHSIRDYAKCVSTLHVGPFNGMSLELSGAELSEGLAEKKDKLSKKFRKMDRPVVVMIDDIDRMEEGEIFEVLRLIRNTGDLSNVIYIVTYDKKYVTEVLKNKTQNTPAYLEKIFQVEIHLPEVEKNMIWITLYQEIAFHFEKGESFARQLFSRFDQQDYDLILAVLDNYRRAKRFARLFMLNLNYLIDKYPKEIKYLDMFWLELLQCNNKEVYDLLADDFNNLLYMEEERLKLKDGILRDAIENSLHKYDGALRFGEETKKILERLFGNYIKTTKLSISYAENYSKYFGLSISDQKLSIGEFNQLFEERKTVEEVINGWCNKKKYISSIFFQFNAVSVSSLTDNQLKKYLNGLLEFALIAINSSGYRNWSWNVKQALHAKIYSDEGKKSARLFVIEWFERRIIDQRWAIILSQLLNHLFVTTYYDENNREESIEPLVISNDDVKMLLEKAMNAFLANHSELTAVDLLKDQGDLYSIFRNCCVTKKNAMISENYTECEQVAFDAVISFFSKKQQKPSLKEYDEAMSKLFYEKPPVFNNPIDEYNYEDYMYETYDRKMQEYFGNGYDSKTGSKLSEFRQKCFESPNDNRDTNVNV